MNKEQESPRIRLIRETATLQLKLLLDGFRDALLIPVSLVASLVGLLKGGDDCDTEFQRVLKLGRRSERWINLFGHQRPLGFGNQAGSMDHVLEQVEAIVVEQYKKGKSAVDARDAVRKVIDEVASREGGDKPEKQGSKKKS
jgi:hypothetical protein